MTQRNIKPAHAGLIVRRPENARPIAAQGEQLEWSAYWQRRWNEGDIVDAPHSTQARQEPPKVKRSQVAIKKGGAK